jgi:hypothetical protein
LFVLHTDAIVAFHRGFLGASCDWAKTFRRVNALTGHAFHWSFMWAAIAQWAFLQVVGARTIRAQNFTFVVAGECVVGRTTSFFVNTKSVSAFEWKVVWAAILQIAELAVCDTESVIASEWQVHGAFWASAVVVRRQA